MSDRCDPNGCDGAPCHWQCVMSEDVDCECHCNGEYHGIGLGKYLGSTSHRRIYEVDQVPNGKVREFAREQIEKVLGRRRGKLRDASDEELARRLNDAFAGDDKAAIKALSQEAARRDRNDRARAKASSERSEHIVTTEAAYRRAEDETNGHMLSRAGQAKNIDPKALWSMPERRARHYASEELNEHWDKHGRLTLAAAKAEARRSARVEREMYEGVPY